MDQIIESPVREKRVMANSPADGGHADRETTSQSDRTIRAEDPQTSETYMIAGNILRAAQRVLALVCGLTIFLTHLSPIHSAAATTNALSPHWSACERLICIVFVSVCLALAIPSFGRPRVTIRRGETIA